VENESPLENAAVRKSDPSQRLDVDDGDRSNYLDSIWRKSESGRARLGATLVSCHFHGGNGQWDDPSKDGKVVWSRVPSLGV